VRAKNKWTPGGIVLWLIAAVLATLIVCSQSPPTAPPLPATNDVEIEVELVEWRDPGILCGVLADLRLRL